MPWPTGRRLGKDSYLLNNIQRIPTGRGISAHFNGIKIINIYAPSGFEKKREREEFYNGDIACLLMHSSDNTFLAGDFNCVLTPSDSTGSLTAEHSIDNRFRPGGRMGREPGANDIHALYGARCVATRQDILIATNVEVKTDPHFAS